MSNRLPKPAKAIARSTRVRGLTMSFGSYPELAGAMVPQKIVWDRPGICKGETIVDKK